jgi:hypothetical protein
MSFREPVDSPPRVTTASALSSGERNVNGIPPQRYYTILSMEPPGPFGFGSCSPARPEVHFPDTPGPGKYEPKPSYFHVESVRGHGSGFTSIVPRKLGFVRGTKNPAPSTYDPSRLDRRIKPRIGSIPRGRRCSCFPDEREASSTPGPGSYDIPPLEDKASTSVFKSRSDRVAFPVKIKPRPRFDGRTFRLGADD